ncbi:uncharacterized protein TNCV_677441 [Trichonephila clavipes]|nr:uncharacterized protein TNCV_677441 [Trichonephila clavipes]
MPAQVSSSSLDYGSKLRGVSPKALVQLNSATLISHSCNSLSPIRYSAASPLVRLVEGEERWEASDHPQGVLLLNWGGTEPNRTVTCMVLKATANDKRHFALTYDEFRGPRSGLY